MIDILMVLAGGVLGYGSAMGLRLYNSLFGRRGESHLNFLRALVVLPVSVGLLVCGTMLAIFFVRSPERSHIFGQNTPIFVFVSWLGTYLFFAILEFRGIKK